MKKAILTLGVITLLIGITFIPVGASPSKPITKERKVYGPLMAPSINGQIRLSEDATYSSKYHIGKLFIYRNLKLTGLAWGPGPHPPGDPGCENFIFQQILCPFRSWDGIGSITLKMKLWIGEEKPETAGALVYFAFRATGQAFVATLETLD